MNNQNSTIKNIILPVTFLALAIFFCFALICWTIIPHLQVRAYFKYAQTGSIKNVLENDFIFHPHTNAQMYIEYNILGSLIKQKIDSSKAEVLDVVMNKMLKLMEKEGANQPQYILIGKGYDKKAQILNDKDSFKIAEGYYKKAIDLGEKKPRPHLALGLSLLKQTRIEEAIKLLRSTLALEERVPLSHFYLGLALAASSENNYQEAFEHMEFFMKSSEKNPDTSASLGAYQKFLSYFSRKGDKEKTLQSVRRLVDFDTDQREVYLKIADYIEKTGKIPVLNIEFEN